jgi:hypothetical protein
MRNLGRRIILLGVFIVCSTRVIAYSPIWGGPHESSGPMFLTAGGSAMWLYVVLWGVGAVLALVGIIRGKAGLAILWYVFLMLTWSAGYVGAWIAQEGDRYTRAWMSAALYAGNGVVTLGAFYLIRQVDDMRAADITRAHKIVRRKE